MKDCRCDDDRALRSFLHLLKTTEAIRPFGSWSQLKSDMHNYARSSEKVKFYIVTSIVTQTPESPWRRMTLIQHISPEDNGEFEMRAVICMQ